MSKFLQETQTGSKVAQDFLSDTVQILQTHSDKRETVSKTVPRKASRQNIRESHLTNSIVTYYKQTIYIRALDNLLPHLKYRSPKETLHITAITITICIFPSHGLNQIMSMDYT